MAWIEDILVSNLRGETNLNKRKTVAINIFMLYLMNFSQLLLPLLTLPYLTRVLSVDGYGVVSYVKSIMIYVTLIIEFGFLLSGTRSIVLVRENKDEINKVLGTVTVSKLILSLLAFVVLIIMIMEIPILNRHPLFVLLSFGTPFLSIFLYDYLFRGLEQMQIVTIRFLIMKGMSTLLTFIFIKNENDLDLIPVLDIIGAILAVIWVNKEVKNMGYRIKFDGFSNVIRAIKTSFIYFVSDAASTAFGALNTFFVGIYLSASDVAFWGILMSVVGAIQSMYNPISNGIYPRMVKEKNIKLFIRIIGLFVPILLVGSAILFYEAKLIIVIIAGQKYVVVAKYLKEAVPLIIISFFSILCGWPLLGGINRAKEVTSTTVATGILQVLGIALLIFSHNFTFSYLLLVRTLTELFMAISRIGMAYKYRYLFK